jgi:acyl-CoA synthetase (AMP-forming)/AMP-acid ligase II
VRGGLPDAVSLSLGLPPVLTQDRTWPAAELAALARRFGAALAPRIPGPEGLPVGVVMAPHPETIALFFALAAFPVPLILLAPEPRSWQSSPPLPPGTIVVLPPRARHLAPACTALGLRPVGLEPGRGGAEADGAVVEVRTPGLVFLTSGSAGRAKPVYRTLRAIVAQGRALNETVALGPEAGVLGVLPLSGAQGFVNSLVQAALAGAPLGLLTAVNHRTVLAAFSSRRYGYMSATPLLANLLSRCPLPAGAPLVAPPVCRIAGGRVPEAAFRGFATRFGVTLRPQYGTTEYGTIAVDVGAAADVRPEAVGRPLPDVEIRIGDDPVGERPPGAPGRIWLRSPWRMEGYGYPPRVESRPDRAGWSPTDDVGVLDETGHLRVLGRLDECFKTSSGHLVSPDGVTDALIRHPQIDNALVVPLASPRGVLIGALVQTRGTLGGDDVRRHAARLLPPWAQPHVVDVTDALPRLPGGKPDRLACIARLQRLL